jgi:hypothetical protein
MKKDNIMSLPMRNMLIFKTFLAVVVVTLAFGIGRSFAQAPMKSSRILALVRVDGTTVGSSMNAALPKGTVELEINGAMQRFRVNAKNMASTYTDGLAVYIGPGTDITNGTPHYVSVMAYGTNGTWSLEYTAHNYAAPPQLGVDSLQQLVGETVFVASGGTNVILRAVVLPLVENPAQFSYHARSPLYLPDVPLSPNARGWIRVKYNGKTGASLIEVKARKLNRGNSYIAGGPTFVTDSNACAEATLAETSSLVWRHDTGKGDDLPNGTNDFITTIMELRGAEVDVDDCFGGEHLWGNVPYPPYLTPE